MKAYLPDPADLMRTLDYLEYEAGTGTFNGHTTSYAVLIYLARSSWRKVPNAEDAPIGAVMWGKSSLKIIASHNGLSIRSARRALRWLESQGWINCTMDRELSGRQTRNYIRTMLDQTAHEYRLLQRETETLMEGGQIDRDEADRLTGG